MHFLSHYYVDRGRNDPLFALGALIPDITPHFTRTYNSKIRNKKWELDGPAAAVHRGILRHYELDAAFHSSTVFRDCCSRAGISMAEAGLDREKYRFWFLGHIVTEVLLDRQLILLNPGLVDEYYNVLSSVDTNKFDAYLYFNDSNEEKSKILSNFIMFLDIKFLRHLEKIEGAAEGITRTVYRATGVAFTDEDRERLIAALHNIENDIRYSSKKLLEIWA
jgi:hypothetical protein